MTADRLRCRQESGRKRYCLWAILVNLYSVVPGLANPYPDVVAFLELIRGIVLFLPFHPHGVFSVGMDTHDSPS